MTTCARCGQVEVEGSREDMPMRLPCERSIIVEDLSMNETESLRAMIAHRDARIRELESRLHMKNIEYKDLRTAAHSLATTLANNLPYVAPLRTLQALL